MASMDVEDEGGSDEGISGEGEMFKGELPPLDQEIFKLYRPTVVFSGGSNNGIPSIRRKIVVPVSASSNINPLY
jgi:hypothetical protein